MKRNRSLLAIVSLLTLILGSVSAQERSAPENLAVHQSLTVKMDEQQSREFMVEMRAGEFGRVVVIENGIDAVVTLYSPHREEIAVTNSAAGYFGREYVLIYAPEPGIYTVKTWAPRRPLGSSELKIEFQECHPATSADLIRHHAQQLQTEALKRNYRGTPELKQQALTIFQEARELWRISDEAFKEIDCSLQIGLICLDLGEARKAIPFFESALLKSGESKIRILEMQALRLLGESYLQIGDLRLANEILEHTMKFSAEEGGFLLEIHALNSIGSIAISQGEVHRAIKTYLKILELSRQNKLQSSEGMALSKLGKIYSSIGEYQRALDYLNTGLKLHRSLLDRAFTLNSMGKLYLAMGEIPKSREFFSQALDLARRHGNQVLISNALNNLGMASMLSNHLQQALEYFQQALDISSSRGLKPEIIESLTNLGKAYGLRGKPDQALSHFETSLALSREIGDRSSEMTNLAEIGSIYVLTGEIGQALPYLKSALSLSREFYSFRDQANILLNLARASDATGDLALAHQQLKEAVEISEKLRSKFILQNMRASFLGTVQDIYRLYIETLVKASHSTDDQYSAEAFRINEMARARSLLEQIVESEVDLRAGVDADLIKHETALRQKIDGKLELLIPKENDLQTISKIRQDIATLESELELVESNIRQKSPSYAALTYPKPLSVSDIQRDVIQDEKTLLLEYSLGKETSYLWEVSRNEFRLHRLPAGHEIEGLSRNYYRLISKRPAGSAMQRRAERKAVVEVGQKLSQILLAPVAEKLHDQTLIIVGDGALQYVPFGALPLPVQEPEANSSGQAPAHCRSKRFYKPLMLNHQILGAQSATSLAVLSKQLKNRPLAPRTLAVLADPVFGKYDDRVRGQQYTSGLTASGWSPDLPTRSGNGDQERSTRVSTPRRASFHSGRKPGNQVASPPPESLAVSIEKDVETNDEDNAAFGKRFLIPRLPYTRDEANAIFELAPADSLRALDFQTTRSLAMDGTLGQYRFLHFALHGSFDNKHPENSGLMFSTVDQNGQPQNGLLTAKDVYNLKLPVELVVLSACQSGLGREIRGEGLLGLTRSFMHAGARRVVASLWNVNDAATSALMKKFYQGLLLEKGLPPKEALRQAQIAVWKESKWQAPYFWAAFVLQGER